MKWKAWLLFLVPAIVFGAPKKVPYKDLQFSYVVSTNDVAFYLNQPVYLKVSLCEKRQQLCTEMSRTNPFTLTSTNKALHLVLSTSLKGKAFQEVITKRKIFWEDAKIKFEMIYTRADIFSKFVEEIYFYKYLTANLPGNRILKDSVNVDSGLVEVSQLLINE